jgi:hypothetical protein
MMIAAATQVFAEQTADGLSIQVRADERVRLRERRG